MTTITRQKLEEHRLKVADFMVNLDMMWLTPVFDRLEREIELMDAQEASMDKARELLQRQHQ